MSSRFLFACKTLAGAVLATGLWLCPSLSQAQENDPDVPRFAKPVNTQFSKEEFMTRRAEAAAMKRGLHADKRVNPRDRQAAI